MDSFLVRSTSSFCSVSVLTRSSSLCSFFFFGGLSIHLSQALLAHMFSYNITWGATKKEVERSNFWLEVPKIIKRFWIALVLCILALVAMTILATDIVPRGWQIPGIDWAVILLSSSQQEAIYYSLCVWTLYPSKSHD